VQTLGDFAPGLIDLALAPNAQRLYGLSADGGTVVRFDCGRETSPEMRVVVTGDSPDGPGRQLGCIDTSVVAILRDSVMTVVTTHRIPSPPETTAASEPLQRVAIDEGIPNQPLNRGARLTVSHTRNWLALTTVVEGGSTVLRAAVAGVRVGGFSTRNSPALEGSSRVLAATVSPADELVLVTASPADATDETAAASQTGLSDTVSLSMYATPGGEELLRLDTGLRDIRDACFTNSSGRLWVITGSVDSADPPQPAGLWRLDATIRERRQAIEAVLVTPLAAPQAVTAGNDEVIYAAVEGGRKVVEIRPAATSATSRD